MACEAADNEPNDKVQIEKARKVEKRKKHQKLCRAVHHSAFTSVLGSTEMSKNLQKQMHTVAEDNNFNYAIFIFLY